MSCNRLESNPGVSVSNITVSVDSDGIGTYPDGSTVILARPEVQPPATDGIGTYPDESKVDLHMPVDYTGVRTEARVGSRVILRRERLYAPSANPSPERFTETQEADISAAEAAITVRRRKFHIKGPVKEPGLSTEDRVRVPLLGHRSEWRKNPQASCLATPRVGPADQMALPVATRLQRMRPHGNSMHH